MTAFAASTIERAIETHRRLESKARELSERHHQPIRANSPSRIRDDGLLTPRIASQTPGQRGAPVPAGDREPKNTTAPLVG
jgi:hypothetical protein